MRTLPRSPKLRLLSYCFTLFVLFLFFTASIHAQIFTSGASSGTMNNTGTNLRDPTAAGPPIGKFGGEPTFIALSARGGLKLPAFENVSGSPFLHPEYNLAYVRVKSGFASNGVMTKFNIYGNEVIFSQNGNELALDSLDYVVYTAVNKNGTVETIKLKSGFPPIGSNTAQTIYQLLDSGSRVQLLKYHYQKIGEVKSMGSAPAKEFVSYHELYVNTPSGGIKRIKADINSLKEALPEFADQIEKIVNEKKLKLKKEADLIQLIHELNNSSKAF